MVKRLKIKNRNIAFVFKTKYDKTDKILEHRSRWRKIRLGLFYSKTKVVSTKNFKDAKSWSVNLVNEYMFGVNLIIIKMWFTISKNAMILDIKENGK